MRVATQEENNAAVSCCLGDAMFTNVTRSLLLVESVGRSVGRPVRIYAGQIKRWLSCPTLVVWCCRDGLFTQTLPWAAVRGLLRYSEGSNIASLHFWTGKNKADKITHDWPTISRFKQKNSRNGSPSPTKFNGTGEDIYATGNEGDAYLLDKNKHRKGKQIVHQALIRSLGRNLT